MNLHGYQNYHESLSFGITTINNIKQIHRKQKQSTISKQLRYWKLYDV